MGKNKVRYGELGSFSLEGGIVIYQIGFLLDSHITETNNIMLNDYSWWSSLIDKTCKTANRFEIRGWKNERDIINGFGKEIDNTQTSEIVFKGAISDEFFYEIINNYLTEEKCLKWFTLNLYRDESMLLSSQHYGSELHLFHVQQEEIAGIENWAEQYPCILRVDVDEFEDDFDENMWGPLELNRDEIQQYVTKFLNNSNK